MTDVEVENATASEVEVVKAWVIPLKGGAGHVTLEDSDALPIDMYRYIFQQGLETVVNSAGGMAKLTTGITKLTETEQTTARAKVRKQAQENVKALLDGSLKLKGSRGAVKVEGAVQTEALRIAKEMVKDHIRSNGQKIGAYKASEITAAAKEVIKDNPDIVKKAIANLDERANGAKTTKGLDLKALFGAKAESDEVKAKPKGANLKKAREEKAKVEGKGAAEGQVRVKPKADTPKVAPRASGKPETGHHGATH